MIYAYIAVMAGVTYLIRLLPFTLVQKKIRNRFLCSFLYYVPYACLTTMAFPSILFSTSSFVSAALGLVVAIVLAFRGKGLFVVAVWTCIAVFIAERILPI